MNGDEFDAGWFATLRRRLLAWYRKHGRDLPWRRTRDAYRIWISEVMLQQTTVAAVIPYFERFLDRFPTVHDLARADEQDVLRLWEGLGYYSRARNIHKAARAVVEQHSGVFPESAEELQKLPGIGRYTAGAIASFAFDTAAPIVEANTLRLYCRLIGFEGDPRAKVGQDLLWQFAERALPRKAPGELNQALMELGGTVCSVKEPACNQCPLRRCCRAFRNGKTDSIPRPKARPKITGVTHVNVIVRRRGAVLLRRHGEDERWSGLWDFPRYELTGELAATLPDDLCSPTMIRSTKSLAEVLRNEIRQQTGIDAEIGGHLTELTHAVTRYRIRLLCFEADYMSGRLRRGEPLKWVPPGGLEEFPLSTTARKLAAFA